MADRTYTATYELHGKFIFRPIKATSLKGGVKEARENPVTHQGWEFIGLRDAGGNLVYIPSDEDIHRISRI